MNRNEQRFITLLRSNTMRSFYAAHRILDSISTGVLIVAANELVTRATYLHITDTLEKAKNANQFASQIYGVLKQRNQDVTDIYEKIIQNINTMY